MSSEQGAPEAGPGSEPAGQPSEAELRAALEAQLDQIPVAEVVLDACVSLLNLGARRLGLTGGGGAETGRDAGQARTAIDAARALLVVLEGELDAERLGALRDALSQLQLAYARAAGGPPPAGDAPPGEPEPPAAGPEAPGPAQSSGRLWLPGQ